MAGGGLGVKETPHAPSQHLLYVNPPVTTNFPGFDSSITHGSRSTVRRLLPVDEDEDEDIC